MAKRCFGCMQMKNQVPLCEHCGYNENIDNMSHQLPIGTVLHGQYQVGKALGQGGFGITYIGWDMALDHPVAIKEYYPGNVVSRNCGVSLEVTLTGSNAQDFFQHNRDRFLQEARVLAKLRDIHGIVRVLNLFAENNTAYIIMEYVQGIDLRRYIRMSGGRLPADQTLNILRPVMESLQKVHEAGLIHRDVTPDNIMLQKDGTVKLLDFGAVCDVSDGDGDIQHSTEAILKYGFAPIEQYQKKGTLGPWTDVYALCATIFYCTTGKVPAEAPERMAEDVALDWSVIPGLSREQIAALDRGMALRVKDRTASMRELQEELFRKTEATSQKGQKKKHKEKEKDGGLFGFRHGKQGERTATKQRESGKKNSETEKKSSAASQVSRVQTSGLNSRHSVVQELPPTVHPEEEYSTGSAKVPEWLMDDDIVPVVPEVILEPNREAEKSVTERKAPPVQEAGKPAEEPEKKPDPKPEMEKPAAKQEKKPESLHEAEKPVAEREKKPEPKPEVEKPATKREKKPEPKPEVEKPATKREKKPEPKPEVKKSAAKPEKKQPSKPKAEKPAVKQEKASGSKHEKTNAGNRRNKKTNLLPLALLLIALVIIALFAGRRDSGEEPRMDLPQQETETAAETAEETAATASEATVPETTAPETTEPETTVPEETEPPRIPEPWEQNVMAADLCLSGSIDEYYSTGVRRRDITEVTFLDTLKRAPDTAQDISEDGSGSVLIWEQNKKIFIAAENGINGIHCAKLFYGMLGLKKVTFNNAIHTDFATDMSQMFFGCEKLSSLDLGDLVTANVTNMDRMFYNCKNLTRVTVGEFDLSGLESWTEFMEPGQKFSGEPWEEYIPGRMEASRRPVNTLVPGDYTCSVSQFGDLLVVSGENLRIEVQNGQDVTVTVTGLDIKETYLLNHTESKKNFSEYAWYLKIISDSTYQIGTVAWTDNPGNLKERTIDEMDTQVLKANSAGNTYSPVSSAEVSSTGDSIIWKFSMKGESLIDFANVKAYEVTIYSAPDDMTVTQNYTAE